MIGGMVEKDDDIWNIYLLLCDVVLSPCISVESINYLDVTVSEFYQAVLEHAPGIIRPKFHYLLHYARLLLDFGSLRYLWCMRFEAYHQKIKKNC